MKVTLRTLSLPVVLMASLALAQDAHPDASPPTEPVPVITGDPGKGNVTVSSKGHDVRNVLFDMFEQAEKSFVLEPNVRFMLYLSLRDVPFDEALGIVCATSGLEWTIDGGIFFIKKSKASPSAPPAKAIRRLTEADLAVKVTTKFQVTDIRAVFAELGKQSGLTIEVAADVPKYRVDAVLNGTPVKNALAIVTQAAGLVYSLSDHGTIIVSKAKPH